MEHLIGKKVSAIADHGTYKGKEVTGILSFNKVTGQYMITINMKTVSVFKDTITEK